MPHTLNLGSVLAHWIPEKTQLISGDKKHFEKKQIYFRR